MAGNHDGGTVGFEGTRTLCLSSEIEHLLVPKFEIEVVKGPDKGASVIWEEVVFHAGVAPDNDLVLTDPTVSRHHLRLDASQQGFRVRDLGSKNGVLLDGILVRDAWLPGACKVVLGDTTLKIRPIRETMDLELSKAEKLGGLVGSSPQMRRLFALVQRVAASEATVLIEAESGTGKELVAQAVHDLSSRRSGPFEIIDCSAIPESILESELFGHTRGAFTGAVASRKGLVESAVGGTVFLDEIGELPLAMQAKILRLIERREIRPVGADGFHPVDVRIVAATNRVLREEVAAGRFREDLFYRLNVVRLRIPPLRERREDIALLADHFLTEFSARDKRRYSLPHAFLSRLMEYEFPGNVRELRNILEQGCLLPDAVELDLSLPRQRPAGSLEESPLPGMAELMALPYKDAKERLTALFEEHYWTQLLSRCSGNVSEAARQGGIHRKSLEYLMRKWEGK